MKKGLLRCAAIAMLTIIMLVGPVFAAEDGKNFIANKVGVGYQGLVAGSFLNGLSVRGWITDRIGLEGSGFYGRVSVEEEIGGLGKMDTKADLWMVEAKAMFAAISRSYSKFYVGGKIGYGQIGVEDFEEIDGSSFFAPGVFIGSEWSFPQLPEVGFNFDIGYSWLLYSNHVNDDPYVYLDAGISGITATFGIHYYF